MLNKCEFNSQNSEFQNKELICSISTYLGVEHCIRNFKYELKKNMLNDRNIGRRATCSETIGLRPPSAVLYQVSGSKQKNFQAWSASSARRTCSLAVVRHGGCSPALRPTAVVDDTGKIFRKIFIRLTQTNLIFRLLYSTTPQINSLFRDPANFLPDGLALLAINVATSLKEGPIFKP